MKHIDKGAPPPTLESWKQQQVDAGVSPAWGDLQNPQKADCRSALVAEQGALCCYCNGKILTHAMHIEHLTPRAVDGSLALAWTNLLGCCPLQNLRGPLRMTQSHCGEFRGSRRLGVTPLDSDCETRFGYSLRGDIRADSLADTSAQETIRDLNLTAESLRSRRQRLIAQAYEDLEILSEGEWLTVYVARGIDGFHEFAAMFRWFFNTSWHAEKQAIED